MKRSIGMIPSLRLSKAVGLASVSMALAVVLVACGSAAPAPAPTTAAKAAPAATSAPAAPTKAAAPAAPTTAPAAPTAAPAKQTDFPAKNRPITLIVPFAAGGPVDITARLLSPLMEKDLGTPVQVVNKAGASTQVGIAELVGAKPDGYTLAMPSIPTTLVTYLDAERKAPYGRKDFEMVAAVSADASAVSTKADSPFKTLKDLVDAAKANPEKVKVGTAGVGGVTHLTGVALEESTGIRFSYVHFDGGAPSTTAALAGHTDASFSSVGAVRGPLMNGQIRVLALFDKDASPLLPDVKTANAQGYNIEGAIINGIIVPAGTPKAVKDVLEGAIKKATADADLGKRLNDAGLVARFMDQAAYEKYWAGNEEWTKRYMGKAK